MIEEKSIHNGRTEERLFAYMVARARFQDRLYFCADATAARDLGLSRRTIIRARQRLEQAGRIARARRRLGRAVVYSFPSHVRRMPRGSRRVTQRTPYRNPRPNPKPSNPRYARVGAAMSELERASDTQPAARLPNSHDIIAATVDTMNFHGIPVTSRNKGILARQSKELLEDGFSPDVILTACVLSIRRGAPTHMHFIAQDIAVARANKRLTRRQYEAELGAAAKLLDPAENSHRERLQKILGSGSTS